MLKPPVTLDALMKEWSQDKIVDGTELEKEILKISYLHGKYLNIMSYHRVLFRKMETDYKVSKGLREDYYHGYLTKEEMDRLYAIKDPKTGKVTEQCKEIKKHKKLEVEDTKKK